MGEFDDEIVAVPAESEPAEEQPPEPADDPIAAIQDQLALEDSEAVATPEAEDAEPALATEAEVGPPTDEDLAAAVAASSNQVETEGTLDDIAPGTTHISPADEVEEESLARYGAPWWPFLIYLVVWLVFAGVAVWQLQQVPQGVIVYETEQYTAFVFGGLALAVSGVFLVLAVWLGARTNPDRQRKGLFTSALIMGAMTVLIGVVVWWGAIMALDYLRLGRLI